MITHKLKTLPPYWDAVKRGEKTFEVRRDDRGFQKGDRLLLQRYDGRLYVANDTLPLAEADNITCEITYVLTGGQFGIEPGYVVLGIKEVKP